MKSLVLTICLVFLSISSPLHAKKSTLTFPSADGLTITADSYITRINDKRPLIVLFHQAGWSRGEYLEIAPKLNDLGFNALAVDLRSGGQVNGITNETAKRAIKAKKRMAYIDALQDVDAAMVFARNLVGDKTKIIAWGSSYSASLVLKVASKRPELVNAVMAFSPGEYFKESGAPADWIQQSARLITRPVFIASAKAEQQRWKPIFDVIKTKKKIGFVPNTDGQHGSRALWEKYEDNNAYWVVVKRFLRTVK